MYMNNFYRAVVVINHIASNREISNDSTANKHKHFTTFCKLQCTWMIAKEFEYI